MPLDEDVYPPLAAGSMFLTLGSAGGSAVVEGDL